MLVSMKWLKEFIDFRYSAEELDGILTMLGVEVEHITDNGKKYANFYTAKVLECEKHPNADKLHVCKVSLGSAEKMVVCGAPNIAAGQTVVLGVTGAVVPAGGFTIEKRKLRGCVSDGMICSKSELELGDEHDGIWVLPESAPIGVPIADYLGINDVILEVSLTPNKSDCLSHLGIAREIAAYMRSQARKPEISLAESDEPVTDAAGVEIKDPDHCPRYTARVVKGAKIGPSPDWLKNRLLSVGLRPINNVVDVTNYILMEVGQPLHAFDLDKVADKKIVVRTASDGEKFTTLDGKERELDGRMLMICDGGKPVAIGGVMGGQNSEITDGTQNILIESAFFTPSSIRRTAKKLGIQSDSSYRFERGTDVDNLVWALDRAAMLIAETSGGKVLSGYIDEYPAPIEKKKCRLRYQRANDVIGINLTGGEMNDMLRALGFGILSGDAEGAEVEIPAYRVDAEGEIDLIEEIARLYNYDNIEPRFYSRVDFETGGVPAQMALPPLRRKFGRHLVENGFNEVLTQSMVDPQSARIFNDDCVQIANPLGEELSIMRPSIIPSMLKTVRHNIRMGTPDLKLFETGRSFMKLDPEAESLVKGFKEFEELAVVMTGKAYPKQWGMPARPTDFYDIKGRVEELLESAGIMGASFSAAATVNPAFSKNAIAVYLNGIQVGIVGEIETSLLRKYDIEQGVFMAVLDMGQLYGIKIPVPQYSPVPPYPGSSRDLAFVFDKGVSAEDIRLEIIRHGGPLLRSVTLFDVYAGKSLGEGKVSMAFSLDFSSPERTLVEKDVEEPLSLIINAIETKHNGVLRKI